MNAASSFGSRQTWCHLRPAAGVCKLYADGAPLETPQAFTLREAAMMMDG